MNLFPTQAINELASEFKLLRKDIQAIKIAVHNIEQSLNQKPYEEQSK